MRGCTRRRDCERVGFATSITLAPGTYSARALLIDAAGNSRTTILGIAPFTVFGNDDVRIPIDFPSNSFF